MWPSDVERFIERGRRAQRAVDRVLERQRERELEDQERRSELVDDVEDLADVEDAAARGEAP